MQRDQAHRTNELLERIAIALEKKQPNILYNGELKNIKDIPGFEGTKDALDNLCNVKGSNLPNLTEQEILEEDDVHNDYLNDLVADMNQIEFLQFHNQMSFSFPSNDSTAMSDAIYELEYEECLGAIRVALFVTGDDDYVEAIECSGFDKERKDELAKEYVINLVKKENTTDPIGDYDPYTYDNDLIEYLDGIKNDSDYSIRVDAKFYEDEYLDKHDATKKECILDYVTNTFRDKGARYTDIIKFAYYLGAHNAPKYDNNNRGYYSCAFSYRMNGHLIMGGKDYLVKGINSEGQERYYALSKVNYMTDYWKRIGRYER